MAGGSLKNRKKRKAAKMVGEKGTVSVEYECPLDLLPRDLWVMIATKVASYSIKDLFNMQTTCNMFLGAARSDAVYKEASMLELPIASFLYYYGLPEHRFIECCAEAGNPGALLQVGMTGFVWFGHCVGGMETLTMSATGGDLEACYMCAMLLLCNAKEDEEHMRKGLEFFRIVRDSGALERCKEVFRRVFAGTIAVNSIQNPRQASTTALTLTMLSAPFNILIDYIVQAWDCDAFLPTPVHLKRHSLGDGTKLKWLIN